MKTTSLLILASLLTACTLSPAGEFIRNRQKWQASGIVHYRFSLSVLCFCPFSQQMPVKVEVNGGQILFISDADGSVISPRDAEYEFIAPYGTIDKIFAKLDVGLNGGADNVSASYDPVYGYPVQINFDYLKNVVDDELAIRVSEFEVLR